MIVVEISGGLVQWVGEFNASPEVTNHENMVLVINYDTKGADPHETVLVPGDEETGTQAYAGVLGLDRTDLLRDTFLSVIDQLTEE